MSELSMDVLENLNSCFKVSASEAAASLSDLQALRDFSSIDIPADYVGIIRKKTAVEILAHDNTYFRIWGPLDCIEMNEEYEVQKYIPYSLAIGDDEGGSALIIMTGNKGFGLYKAGFGDLDASDADYVASSLEELLTKGVGADII